MIKQVSMATILIFALTGCGDKIVKMNDFKDINYSYHPHTNSGLEKDTYEMILDDNSINNKKNKLAKKFDEKLNGELNEIIDNKNNSNIMVGKTSREAQQPRGGLYKDRFEKLRINR